LTSYLVEKAWKIIAKKSVNLIFKVILSGSIRCDIMVDRMISYSARPSNILIFTPVNVSIGGGGAWISSTPPDMTH
jgi:hypothetical protein